MEPTAPPEPTGRDVGPFRGVTTVRVHGGYEICRGKDDEGRPVTILTMGPSAAENQALRATLAEAYEWVRATGAPNHDEFLSAGLDAEHPWAASLDGPNGTAGVRRLFDRLVSTVRPPAPGRHTGTVHRGPDAARPARTHDTGRLPGTHDTGRLPAPTDTGQFPRPTDTGQIPRVTDTGQIPRPTDTGQIPRVTDTGQIPRVTDTGQIPRVTDTGRIPRVADAGPARSGPPRRPTAQPVGRPPAQGAAPQRAMPPGAPGQRPPDQGPPTGQLPRIVEQPTGALRTPVRTAQQHLPPGAYPPPGAREIVVVPPPPMPAYQGPAYTAAPRPIAPPPASALPARQGGRYTPIPIVLLALGVIAVGVLVVLIALFISIVLA